MHIISKLPFKLAAQKYPNHASAIFDTFETLRKISCRTPLALKCYFKSLDNFKYRDKWYVIDIAGNNIRLLAFIEFNAGRIFVKHIVSHTEYDVLCKRYARGDL